MLFYAVTNAAEEYFRRLMPAGRVCWLARRLPTGTLWAAPFESSERFGPGEFLPDCAQGWETLCRRVGTVIVWNGDALDYGEAVAVARGLGKRVIHLENGFGLADRVQVDLDGVNADSSLARVDLEEIAQYAPQSMPLNWETRATAAAPWPADDQVPDCCLVVPLQIERDSQIRRHSPTPFMGAVLELVRDAAPDDLPVVVKMHPNLGDADAQAALREQFPMFTWVRTTAMAELLTRAACMVTVNSSAGFRAVAEDVPVIALGASVYSRPGLAHCPDFSVEGLRTALHDAAVHNAAEATLRTRWVAWMNEVGLVGANPAAITARILALARR
jgi:hypothetical protein